jgi:hypothetical protein
MDLEGISEKRKIPVKGPKDLEGISEKRKYEQYYRNVLYSSQTFYRSDFATLPPESL